MTMIIRQQTLTSKHFTGPRLVKATRSCLLTIVQPSNLDEVIAMIRTAGR